MVRALSGVNKTGRLSFPAACWPGLVGMLLVCTSCAKEHVATSKPSGEPGTIVVFAAASTADVMKELGEAFAASEGVTVLASSGASSMLARQIEAGAACDVFVSADAQWIDVLDSKGLLESGARRDLMGNELVLVSARGSTLHVVFEPAFNFAESFTGRLSIGDPALVPAGKYARQALEHLGWWQGIEDRVIPAADVRQALRLVELGEAAAGIVYATDVTASNAVTLVGVVPSTLHEPIRYTVAGCRGMRRQAGRFLTWLASPAASEIIRRQGFQSFTRATLPTSLPTHLP